jgi:hypothetical protein
VVAIKFLVRGSKVSDQLVNAIRHSSVVDDVEHARNTYKLVSIFPQLRKLKLSKDYNQLYLDEPFDWLLIALSNLTELHIDGLFSSCIETLA